MKPLPSYKSNYIVNQLHKDLFDIFFELLYLEVKIQKLKPLEFTMATLRVILIFVWAVKIQFLNFNGINTLKKNKIETYYKVTNIRYK